MLLFMLGLIVFAALSFPAICCAIQEYQELAAYEIERDL